MRAGRAWSGAEVIVRRPPTGEVTVTALEIVICTRNRASSLDRTLSALARQGADASAWSVIVIDNGSSDGTSEVVRRHAAAGRIPGLRTVREPRVGLTPARWRGVAEARAEWLAFVDDDCLLEEGWIDTALRVAPSRPRCGALGGRIELEWEREPPEVARRYGWAFAEQDHGPLPTAVDGLAGAGLVLRHEALRRCGWIDEPLVDDRVGDRLISGGDVEIVLRVSGAGYELWYEPSMRIRHVMRPERASTAYLRAMVRGLGASSLVGDLLVWPGSARGLAASLARRTALDLARLARADAARLVRRHGLDDAIVDAEFLRGRLGAAVGLARRGEDRARLLGRAVG